MKQLEPMHDFDRFFERMFGYPTSTKPEMASLKVDILEKDGHVIFKAPMAGMNPEDIEVSIENQVLTIRGSHREDAAMEEAKVYQREVSYGEFTRSFRLPEDLDLEKIEASFEKGMMRVSIPRKEESGPSTISVPINSD